MTKVGMISLGCAKNLVDAEIMLGHLRQAGMDLVSSADQADVLIVNTCAFIDSAKEESINAILEAHRDRGLTKRNHHQRLIVAGCMSQRFSQELRTELPEVDAFIGLDQLTDIVPIVQRLLHQPPGTPPENFVTPRPTYIPDYDTPRFRLTPPHTAYVKIAEGCNHPCSFCVIPQMRGRHRSRTIDSIVREVRQLLAEGVKEINLISQDTTYFGMDRWETHAGPRAPVDPARGETLIHLLQALDDIPTRYWIRLLYTHPAHWSDDLIHFIAQSQKIARYIDIPLQHIHDDMLTAMRRETSSQHIRNLIARMRAGIPRLHLRTTFIVGFPGETEEHFQTLLDFIQETRFERLGVFQYSQEEGSRAAKMQPQVPPSERKARWHRAMRLQQKLARQHGDSLIGQTLDVLAESPHHGRTEADAPDVDGRVLFATPRTPGTFTRVTVRSHDIYDLHE
ncbi:MAG: 30S ribosomal protein S12 methylthiotransferase RimO [Verrucomicrobiia bacterium]